MSFGTTLSEGYSSLLLDRLVNWYVGTGEFHNITCRMLEGLEAKDFKPESVSPTSVGEWFLDLGLVAPLKKWESHGGIYWVVNERESPPGQPGPAVTVQVWFLEELYKVFWKTELAGSLLQKDEEETTLKKKHLVAIGRIIMMDDWWRAHELAIKRQVKNLKATKKVLEA